MSPSVGELADVLDWRAATVLQALDEGNGATVEELVDTTGFSRERVEDRCRQLDAVGLATETTIDGEQGYEVTGQGHGAIGGGLFEEFDLVGDVDVDTLAEQVADLLDRRDDLREQVAQLREDAEDVGERAEYHFGGRDDVAEEVQSLLDDVEDLAETLSDE